MNTLPGNFIIDSCQYTPVYLVQDTGAIQGRTYILTQGNEQEAKPVTNNLKRFYENSGLLENNLTNNVPNIIKPRIQKNKQLKAGNNLKLANFLQPKNNIDNFILPKTNIDNTLNVNKQCLPVSNVILKPTVVSTNVVNTAVREEVDRKIVKIKNFPECLKMASREKAIPKTKPKEEPSTPPIKCTSVQLLKLGDTYHSINQLSDDQMKMVNKALKIFSNPEKSMEPLYDPVTNTCYVYKVVSPRDLTVVHNNNLAVNTPKNEINEIKKEPKKMKPLPLQEKEAILKKFKSTPSQKKTAQEKEIPKYTEMHMQNYDCEPEQPVEIKVTRSGRKVKFPKQIVPQSPQKPKKKNMGIVSCFQCSTEFCSFYRLQKHYESHPTHIPANIHSNLFHCLLAIIKGGPEEHRANIFIQQLELLVEKIKSVFPCILKTIDGSHNKPCEINDDIGRLLGVDPGKYNINVDALTCVKNLDGNCRHYMQNEQHNINESSPVLLPTKDHEKIMIKKDPDGKECVSTCDILPTANKRLRKSKKQESPEAKKSRLVTVNSDPIMEFGIEDLVNFSTNDESAIKVKPEDISLLGNLDLVVDNEVPVDQHIIPDNRCSSNYAVDQTEKTAIPYIQFHSTHFDIRSSPIKPSAAVFNKIQINPEKLSKYESQIIRPLELDSEPKTQDDSLIPTNSPPTPDLQSMLKDDIIQLSNKDNNMNLHDLTYDKDWILDAVNEKSNESFIRANGAIEPSLLHIEEYTGEKLQTNNPEPNEQTRATDNHILSSQNSSVMNFLESLGNECLLYPETDIRNNHVECVDFQLDLFSFSNP